VIGSFAYHVKSFFFLIFGPGLKETLKILKAQFSMPKWVQIQGMGFEGSGFFGLSFHMHSNRLGGEK